jgi:2-polyprenyl-3-methyl-5-hydroxy-6-metoxy-1,4-benzoquinol methylase
MGLCCEMTRVLQPELLDGLAPTDPRAIQSRKDLRRINRIMGNASPIVDYVRNAQKSKTLVKIAEIGAGDGNISATMAEVLSGEGVTGELLMVDREPSFASQIPGWSTQNIKADVFEWLEDAPRVDVIIANLFLHHFTDDQLPAMFRRCAELCDCFAASEPRRSSLAMWFSRRVGLVGCNDVTRHDAEISVRAGFRDSELSALWPADSQWQLSERKAGLFTHFFGARRVA